MDSEVVLAVTVYPPKKRPPYDGKILPSDILGRRRPVGIVKESYPVRARILSVAGQLRDRPLPLIGGSTA
jgi:hypothetical protein